MSLHSFRIGGVNSLLHRRSERESGRINEKILRFRKVRRIRRDDLPWLGNFLQRVLVLDLVLLLLRIVLLVLLLLVLVLRHDYSYSFAFDYCVSTVVYAVVQGTNFELWF